MDQKRLAVPAACVAKVSPAHLPATLARLPAIQHGASPPTMVEVGGRFAVVPGFVSVTPCGAVVPHGARRQDSYLGGAARGGSRTRREIRPGGLPTISDKQQPLDAV